MSSELGAAALKIDRLSFSQLRDHTDDIDSFHWHDVLNVTDRAEIKGLVADGPIVGSINDFRVLFEDNAEVVSYGGELFVGHFHHSVGEEINLVLFEHWVEFLGHVVEESTFDASAIGVNKLDLEKLSSFLGSTQFTSVCDSSLDHPIAGESVKSFDWHEVAVG